jgi:hypothetical protein
MYRKIAILSVLLVVGLAGCGGPGPGAESPTDGMDETPGDGAGETPGDGEGTTPTDGIGDTLTDGMDETPTEGETPADG